MAHYGLTEEQSRKVNARAKAMRAVKNGLLIRPGTCSKCNKQGKPQGHHPDYSKPLEVIWLCRSCHMSLHGNLGTFWQSEETKAKRGATIARRRLHSVIQQAGEMK